LKVLLVNLLAALNFAHVFLFKSKKNVWKIRKRLKKVKNVTKIKKRKKSFFYIYGFRFSCGVRGLWMLSTRSV